MAGRGRDRVLPAWMASSGNGVPGPPGPPSTGSNWADVDQIATAAVLQEQDADLRATLAQQSGQKRDFGEVQDAQANDPALVKDKLLRLTHEIRGERQVTADARERGAGDWQHYKPPSAVLKEVAARSAQPRLTGPRPPGPPPLQPPGPPGSRRPPGPPPMAPNQAQSQALRLPGPPSTGASYPQQLPGPPASFHVQPPPGAQQSQGRQPPGPPPMQVPPSGGVPFQPDLAARHLQPPGPPGSFAPGTSAHVGPPPSGGPAAPLEQAASGVPPGSVQDTSHQGAAGLYGQPNGAEGVPGQPAVLKQPSLERSTSNSSNGGAEGAATTPTELQRQRRPSYFAKPVIRAAPVPAAQPEPPAPGTEENGAPETAAPAAPAAPAAAPAKKELPPLLRARLAKRGILPQAEAGAPVASSAPVAAQPTASAAPVAAAPAAVAPAASSSEPLPEGWSEAVDPTYNHPYWYNVSTGERTWVRPKPVAKAPAPAAASGMAKAPPPPKMTGTPLPLGWSEAVAPDTGLPYYFNAATGQTQWERPTAAAGLSGPFVPSATFTGRVEGYVFKMGAKGLGYYHDVPLAGEPAAAPQAAAPAAAMQMAVAAAAEPRERLNRREVIAAQQERRHASRRQRDEIDPMDPSAYSDAPLGGWSSGMEGAQPRAADTTASGPLFQQRPYPAPGSVLRANQKLISGEPQIGPVVPRK
ncbi:probable polyglutamine-binding protein 1 at C-terminar half [Coccomyxa sp. Obi]|nr:probable polyglutamine-binding protein 1 at C-terminar half [Coccomyxa sp. Obi]